MCCLLCHIIYSLSICSDRMTSSVYIILYRMNVWGPVVQVVSAALSERKAARLIPMISDFHTGTPSAHVRRQSLPVWPPTLNKIPLLGWAVISRKLCRICTGPNTAYTEWLKKAKH